MGLKVYACALLASTCLVSSAHSQIVSPPPVRPSVDENGVDVILGTFVTSQTDVSIGPSYPHGLAYTRLGSSAAWNNAVAGITTGGGQTIVTFNGVSDTFNTNSSNYVSTTGDGATLVLTGSSTYDYTSHDGIKVHFAGNLGYSTGFYDASVARATSVTYPDGTVVLFYYKITNYCANGYENGTCQGPITYAERLQSITNSLGYQLKFTYAGNTLPKTGDPETNYFAYNNITSVAAINNAVEYCDPNADSCTLSNSWPTATYSQSGISQPLTVTDPLGRATRFTYSANNGGVLTGIKRPASTSDNITIALSPSTGGTVTRDGMQFTYAISDSGSVRTTTVTDPASHQRVYVSNTSTDLLTSFKDELGRTTSYLYDSYGRLTQVTYPEGNYVQTSYDANSSTARGNVTQVVASAKSGSGLANITTSAVYPSTCSGNIGCNQPTSTTDARSNTTAYTYDPTHGGVLSVTSPAVNGISPQTRYTYTKLTSYGYQSAGSISALGSVYELTGTSSCQTASSCPGNSDESKSTIGYGPQTAGTGNNLLPVSIAKGAGDGSLTAMSSVTWDPRGNPSSTTDPLGHVTTYFYDLDREVYGVVSPDPDGSGPLLNRATRYTYNADGKVTLVEQGTTPGVPASAPWGSFTVLQQVGTTYDSADRKVAQSAVASNTTYALAQFSYDSLGRLDCAVQRMNPAAFSTTTAACTLGTAGSYGPDRISRSNYDAASEILSTTTAYGVSGLARNEATYTYSANGKVKTLADANNNVTTYVYDGFDRLSQTYYPSPTATGTSSTTDYQQLGYDANGNVTSRRLRDGNSITYVFDVLNRETTHYLPSETGDANPTFTYDLLGRLLSATNGNSSFSSGVYFGYDALGRTISEAENVNNVAGGTKLFKYDAAGRRTQLTWPDNIYVTYGYDNLDEMTTINENGGAALATFSYDDLGRRTARNVSNSTSITYGYDAISRLTSLTLNGGTNSNTITLGNYSPAGEIGTRSNSNDAFAWTQAVNTNRPYTTNGLNQYATVAGTAQGYDAKGNLTSSFGNSYAYSSENHLSTGAGSTLSYDALGRLVYSSSTGIRFDYDGTNLIGEYNASGTLLNRYVFGPGTDEPIIWYQGTGTGNKLYMDRDERGSITRVADGSGATYSTNSYDEFGIPSSNSKGRFQYTGQVWLPEIGMYYYKARMYSPTFGRFMQTDPVGYDDGPNWYNYVHGNPVNLTDPDGLAPPDELPIKPSVDGGSSAQGGIVVSGNPPPPPVSSSPTSLPVNSISGSISPSGDPRGGGSQQQNANSDPNVILVVANPTPKFIVPTNPPQLPPTDLPPGFSVRVMPATGQYPNGYFRIYNGNGQPVDPSTMKPPSNVTSAQARAQTHVELPSPPQSFGPTGIPTGLGAFGIILYGLGIINPSPLY